MKDNVPAALALMVLAFGCGMFAGALYEKDQMQKLAIAHDAGLYKIDKDGRNNFKWKDEEWIWKRRE